MWYPKHDFSITLSRNNKNFQEGVFLNFKELGKYITTADKKLYWYIIPSDTLQMYSNMFRSRKVTDIVNSWQLFSNLFIVEQDVGVF